MHITSSQIVAYWRPPVNISFLASPAFLLNLAIKSQHAGLCNLFLFFSLNFLLNQLRILLSVLP